MRSWFTPEFSRHIQLPINSDMNDLPHLLLSRRSYAVIIPFLLVFTIPLVIFATLTTTFAFSILLFRMALIYIELAMAVIPHYFLGFTSSSAQNSSLSHQASQNTNPVTRRRKRKSSTSSTVSGGTVTPIPGDTLIGLSQSVGATRDFEGVGGWRFGDASDDDTMWANINSRLELPAHHERRHQRSLTGEIKGRSFSPELIMNTSRARTPPIQGTGFTGDGYFPQVPTSPKLKRSASGVIGASNSSGSSKASSTVSSMRQK